MKKIFQTLFFCAFLIGCSQNTQDNNTKQNKEEDSPTYEDIVWKDFNEIIAIVSAKYNTDSSTIKPIVVEYMRLHSPGNYFRLTFYYEKKDTTVFDHIIKPKEPVDSTLIRLSNQYNIELSDLASIIYDFRMFQLINDVE